jgi:hypothetical protein
VTFPSEELRVANVITLPLARMAGQGEPAARDDEREVETIILLW